VEPRLLREERLRSFAEIVLRIGTNLAIHEAERCFSCGNCIQCNVCLMVCPDVAVSFLAEDGKYLIDYDHCKGCGICATECPLKAISMTEES
jgi:2-oxoacid:acceptor oxidoreductase delta subunit (pyruvate/2-ketoisovalerate family)